MEIHKTEDMQRITREEFCSNLDDILDRVNKEQIGFVITEEGKSDLVLCPIGWVSVDGETYSTLKDELIPPLLIDKSIKANAEKVLGCLGLDLETAIRVFIYQIAYTASVPFPIKLPDWMQNPSLIALQEVQKEFEGVAEELGLKSEEDVVKLIREFRKEQRGKTD